VEQTEVYAGDVPGRLVVTPSASGTGLHAEFALADLIAAVDRRRRRRITFRWSTQGEPYTDDVTGLDLTGAGRVVYRRGLRFYVVHTDCDGSLRLGVVINPVTPRRVAGRLLSLLRLRRAR
jgi:hypothetical protein